eukprot:GILK01000598.1.p1 GENE.GILK01000598.1~~GILK01000598.1.p1  ORF type:complete len:419 (+),score=58.86 GILK01000598.1:51-1259(+)
MADASPMAPHEDEDLSAALQRAELEAQEDDTDIPEDPFLLEETKEPNPSGGLKFTNVKQLKAQRKVVWQFIKGIGANLMQGQDIVNVSLPVRLFAPQSFLQRLTDSWQYASYLLNKAAECSDPVEKMKYVVGFAISGLHLCCSNWKPFNPILGETFQAAYPDGTTVVCEQTSHHPPVSHWQMFGPGNRFQFYGYGRWSAKFRGNYLRGGQEGPCTVAFDDGTKITFDYPYFYLKGIVWGDRVIEYQGPVKFVDHKSGIKCDLAINPDATSFVMGLFKKQSSPSDTFRGEIYTSEGSSSGFFGGSKEKKRVLAQATGSWISHVDFNGVRYWDVRATVKAPPTPITEPLPSDCQFREDLIALKQRQFDKAQEWKVLLEERQRADKKLRRGEKGDKTPGSNKNKT